MTPRDEQPWYQAGLAFECTRCGACCTGAPGYVWVNEEEIAAMASHRGISLDVFMRSYVRRVGDRLSLIERVGGDCIFWERGTGCTVYAARPVQCRTWPFWPDNIESAESWDEVTAICPGSGQGPIFTVEEIRATAARVHTS